MAVVRSIGDARVPPRDLDAEAAVVGAGLLEAALLDQATGLLPEHFFSEAHRRIYEAILEMRAAGKAIDTVSVGTWLKDRDRLGQVGGLAYMTELLEAVPVRMNVAAWSATIRDKYRVRQVIATCQRISSQGYLDYGEANEFISSAHTSLAKIATDLPKAPSSFPLLTVTDLCERLPPVPWLVEGLKIAPGPVTLVAGYGYSRKTMAMQDLALAVASGGDVWGTYKARRGRALHLDYEQGRRLTQERYQRLARGRGFELGELEPDALAVCCYPSVYLDGDGAADLFAKALDGYSFCLIDSLRGAAPAADENSSEIRRPLDALARASEKTGCTVVVIHHARKPSEDGKSEARYSIRGSGALFDACASVFVFGGKKDEHTTVKHEKERITGLTLADFALDSLDIPNGHDPRWGLQVAHVDQAQVNAKREAPETRLERVEKAVFEVVRAKGALTKRAVREYVDGVRAATVDVALERLVESGAVVRGPGGTRGNDIYQVRS